MAKLSKFCALLLLACAPGAGGAAWAAGRDALSYLLVSPAPRTAAMGEAYVALAEGPEAAFSNPAGFAFETARHLYAQSFLPPFVEDVKYSNLVYLHPLSDAGLAILAGMMQIGGFTRTVADGSADGYAETGSFSTYDFRFSVQEGRRISDQLGIGLALNYLRSTLGDASANGYSADMGLIYGARTDPLQIGLALQNLGPGVKYRSETDSLPQAFRGGVALRQTELSTLDWIPMGSVASLEYFKPFHDSAVLRGGGEVPVGRSLWLRAGYERPVKARELDSKSGLVDGLTFGLGFLVGACRLDYALVSQGELGLVHRVALDFQWRRG